VFFVRGRIQKEYVRCVFLSGVKIVRVERGMLCFFLQLNAVCHFSSVLGDFRAKKERKKFFKKKKNISSRALKTHASLRPSSSFILFRLSLCTTKRLQSLVFVRTFRVKSRSLFRRCDDDERKQRRSTRRREE